MGEVLSQEPLIDRVKKTNLGNFYHVFLVKEKKGKVADQVMNY
jgi:hypothetical protein